MVPSKTTPQLYRKVAASIHLGRTQCVFRRGTGTQLTEHEFIVLQEINNNSSSHEIIGMNMACEMQLTRKRETNIANKASTTWK